MAVVAGVVICTGDHTRECDLCLNGPVDKPVDTVDNVS